MPDWGRQTSVERVIHLLASLLTLANFVVSTQAVVPTFRVPTLAFPVVDFPLRLGAFLILQAVLAQGTSQTSIKLRRAGAGMPYIFMVLVCAASSWTALFNAQWIFLGPTPPWTSAQSLAAQWAYLIWFVFLGVVAFAVSSYFVDVNFDREPIVAKGGYRDFQAVASIHAWQGLGFLTMFVALVATGKR